MSPDALSASDPATDAGGAVVQLPTAAPRKVRQPRGIHFYRAKQAGLASGAVVPSPAQWRWPADRAAEAEQARAKEKADAIYAAGGLTRGPTLAIVTALLLTIDRAKAEAALQQLRDIRSLALFQAMAAPSPQDGDPCPAITAAMTYVAALIGEPPR